MKGDFRVKTWLSCSFLVSQWDQSMVGVPKGLCYFIFTKPLHLNMLKFNKHIHIESLTLFLDRYIKNVLLCE